jgi:hypothetical protein
MKLADKVQAMIEGNNDIGTLAGALADAERLADLYSEIKPTPFSIPIERYYGLPVECNLERPLALRT